MFLTSCGVEMYEPGMFGGGAGPAVLVLDWLRTMPDWDKFQNRCTMREAGEPGGEYGDRIFLPDDPFMSRRIQEYATAHDGDPGVRYEDTQTQFRLIGTPHKTTSGEWIPRTGRLQRYVDPAADDIDTLTAEDFEIG
jgi:hypothetical protein